MSNQSNKSIQTSSIINKGIIVGTVVREPRLSQSVNFVDIATLDRHKAGNEWVPNYPTLTIFKNDNIVVEPKKCYKFTYRISTYKDVNNHTQMSLIVEKAVPVKYTWNADSKSYSYEF